MTAINPKASARYWARLFGYFLVLAVIGGSFTGGGVYLLDEAQAWPGGPAVDVGTELAAGGVLTAIGGLLLLAGFFTIVLNVVADGVRAGVEAAGGHTEMATAEDAETVDEPGTDNVETKEFAPGESASGPQASSDQQQAGASQPRASAGDDEAWKREVERKLETEDERTTGERTSQRAAEATAEDDSHAAADRPDGQERSRTAETGTQNAPTDPGQGVDESPAEDQLPDQPTGDERETVTPAENEDTGADEAEEWVSAEEVRREQPTSEQSAGQTDEPEPEGVPEETTVADEPQEPRDASDLFSTDDAETNDADDEPSGDPLAPDDIEPQADTSSDPFPEGDEGVNGDGEDNAESE